MKAYTPDYVLDGTARILGVLLPLFLRTPGVTVDGDSYAEYRHSVATLLGDRRAAARLSDLGARVAAIAAGYRQSTNDMRGALVGLERVVVAARAIQPAEARSAVLARQRGTEMALLLLFEIVAASEMANAVATLVPRSHDEAVALRQRMGRLLDLAIERAADQDAVPVMRALRDVQAKVTRDLIERGRPLARVVSYATGVPLPAVVLAHRFYQDAGRADELRAENAGTDHPGFMPMAGRAYSQ
jgi:prophage DNA circulation protein